MGQHDAGVEAGADAGAVEEAPDAGAEDAQRPVRAEVQLLLTTAEAVRALAAGTLAPSTEPSEPFGAPLGDEAVTRIELRRLALLVQAAADIEARADAGAA